MGSFQSVGGTHRQNKPRCVPCLAPSLNPALHLPPCGQERRQSRRSCSRNLGLGCVLETLGLCHSLVLLRRTFPVEIQREIHLFKDTVRVLLTQVVQLTLVRVWNVTHNFVEKIPFQAWSQLLSSSTFILQCLVDVEDESASGLFSSSLNF